METILPPGYQDLPRELAAVDGLLDDPVFFQPYRAHFSAEFGRPSIPIETYLRIMFLKHRYRLGYETLCREVADSLSWSRFCRIPLGRKVPHPSTLEKITTRCGPETIAQLNRALLVKAGAARVVRLDKVRADTTVVAANVAYPTDSGLLVRAIALLTTLVALIHIAGGATRTRVRDRRRAAGRRARSISAHLKLRNEEAKTRVLAITGELADLAEATAAEAARVLVNARRGIARQGAGAPGRLVAAVAELETMLGRTGQVVAQTRSRLGGVMPASASRLVSLHDPDARAIAKGRLGKPVEFGYKGQVIDNVDGIVLDHSVHLGNPADAPLLVPAIGRMDGRRAPALRFGDPRVQALAGALSVSLLAVTGITNKSLRALMTGLLGEPYPMSRASYDLTRLRRNGLITRIEGRNLYRLTDDGLAFAIFYTKVHNRVLRPLMATDRPQAPPQLRAAMRTLDTHIDARLAEARLPSAAA